VSTDSVETVDLWVISGQPVCGLGDVSLYFYPLIDCTSSKTLALYDIAAATADRMLQALTISRKPYGLLDRDRFLKKEVWER